MQVRCSVAMTTIPTTCLPLHSIVTPAKSHQTCILWRSSIVQQCLIHNFITSWSTSEPTTPLLAGVQVWISSCWTLSLSVVPRAVWILALNTLPALKQKQLSNLISQPRITPVMIYVCTKLTSAHIRCTSNYKSHNDKRSNVPPPIYGLKTLSHALETGSKNRRQNFDAPEGSRRR